MSTPASQNRRLRQPEVDTLQPSFSDKEGQLGSTNKNYLYIVESLDWIQGDRV